jgi:hypothetical protein
MDRRFIAKTYHTAVAGLNVAEQAGKCGFALTAADVLAFGKLEYESFC